MRLLDPRTPAQHRRTTGILTASITIAVLLAGCSAPVIDDNRAATPTASASATPSETPTPTPTPTVVPLPTVATAEAPQTAEEAIAAATVSSKTYYDIRADIETNHPEDASAIDAIAMDDAAASVRNIAAYLVDNGLVMSGYYTYDVTGGSAGNLRTSDGTEYPFGAVSLDGCFSQEQMSVLDATGVPPANVNTNVRGVLTMQVAYIPAEKHWIVTSVGLPATGEAEC